MQINFRILAAISFCFVAIGAVQNPGPDDLVQVRFIEKSFHRDVIRMKDDRSTRTLYLSAPVFSLRDVDSARVHSDYDSKGQRYHDVIIRLKRALRDSMYRVTERRLHSRIAIIVDGKLSTPMIMNPFRDPLIPVLHLSETQAHDLARRINQAVKTLQ